MDSAVHEHDWYSDESATFGDRIAAAREAVNLTESDLAKRMGIKVKTLRSWENDMAEPRANKLQMLCGLLNVSLKWLLTGEGQGVQGPDEATVPEDVALLLTELRQLRSEVTRNVERLGVIEKRLHAAIREAAA